jgi:hypothetical protein
MQAVLDNKDGWKISGAKTEQANKQFNIRVKIFTTYIFHLMVLGQMYPKNYDILSNLLG